MAILFFVAASLFGFAFSGVTGVIKESGAPGVSSVTESAINVAYGAGDGASVSAPLCPILSGTSSQETANSFLLSAPEFLSLGEAKDPGMLASAPSKQSGTVAYATKSGSGPSDTAFSLAFK